MNITIVVGAGASLANAQYFRPERMQDTHPPLDVTFFKTLRARGIALTPSLRSYFRRLTGRDPRPSLTDEMRMEDFFKDLYFDFQESPSNEALRSAYTDLLDIYARVIRETTNWLCEDGRTGAPLGQLLASAAAHSESVSIITFNHDLVIENEIERRARLQARWCIDRGYGSLSPQFRKFTRQDVASFPAHTDRCDHDHPLTILKLHGSLNWGVTMRANRPTARLLSGEGGERDLILLSTRAVYPRGRIRTGAAGGRTRWYRWPVIIPPVYAKHALRRSILPVWDDASETLRSSDRIVFFGYSLPQLDVEAEKLFERGIGAGAAQGLRWIDVINPSPASAARYAALTPAVPIRWYPSHSNFLEERPFG